MSNPRSAAKWFIVAVLVAGVFAWAEDRHLQEFVITGPGISDPICVKAPSRLEAFIAASFTVWTKAEWDDSLALDDKLRREHPEMQMPSMRDMKEMKSPWACKLKETEASR